MGIPIFQVDAFTDQPFFGNPAGVCILFEERDKTWMQKVAREMNVSETAFLHKQKDGYNLRWFTPAVEVDLCGHATLASAHTLWERALLAQDEQARFHTQSGLLTAQRKGTVIEMDFPTTPDEPVSTPPKLTEALGVKISYVGKSTFDCLVEVDSEETIRGLRPDFALLKTLPFRGIIVTSLAESGPFDFVSRFFAPAAGINEDPVTGSAHCCLGPYWRKRLGKNSFTAYQASERGGVVHVRLEGERVLLGGQAVTILQGELTN